MTETKMVSDRVDNAPAALRAALPEYDRQAPAEELERGLWVVAGKYALIVGDAQGVIDSGMWYEVKGARWVAKARVLVVEWVDPDRPLVKYKTKSRDPKEFMETMMAAVNDSLVSYETQVVNGVPIEGYIRRGPDGQLFSVLVAESPLDQESQEVADAFEHNLRQAAGLQED